MMRSLPSLLLTPLLSLLNLRPLMPRPPPRPCSSSARAAPACRYCGTPTKTMIASARTAYLARRARDYGVKSGAVRVDMAEVRQRKRGVVASLRAGSERRIEETPGLDLIRGEACFTGPKA